MKETADRIVCKTGSLALIFAFAFLALSGFRTITNPEIYTHLALGEHIAQSGFSATDPLSFTGSDAEFINPCGLYDLMLYRIWNLGGAPLTIILNLAGVLIAFTLLILTIRQTVSIASVAIALFISIWFLFPDLSVSPLIPSMLFASIFIFMLEKPVPPALRWAVLIPLQILWTNIHPGFIIGPVIILLKTLQTASEARLLRGRAHMVAMDQVKQFASLILVAFLVTLINPNGFALHFYLLKNISALTLEPTRTFISPFAHNFSGFYLRNLSILALLVMITGMITLKKRLPMMLAALGVISLFLMLRSFYMASLFAFLAFPFFTVSLDSIAQALKRDKINAHKTANIFSSALILIIAFCALSLISNTTYNRLGSAASFGLGADKSLYPDAAEKIITHPAFPEKVINLPADGGYLAWKYKRSIFTDNRTELFGKEFREKTNRALNGEKEALNEITAKWLTKGAIINCTHPAAGIFVRRLTTAPVNWKLIYFDGSTAILLPAAVAVPFQKEKSLQQEGLVLLEQERQNYEKASGGLFKPANSARLIGGANILLGLGRYEQAETLYKLLTHTAPSMANAWLGYGNALLGQEKAEAAIPALTKAAKLRPQSAGCWLALYRAHKAAGNDEKAARIEERLNKQFKKENGAE